MRIDSYEDASELSLLRSRVVELESLLAERDRREAEQSRQLPGLRAEVQTRLGINASFLELAPDEPEVASSLWGIARSAYLDNPIPALFKEQLFTYLSRFCTARYCLARHTGFLMGYGRPSGHGFPPAPDGSVERLLEDPLPGPEQHLAVLSELAGHATLLREWPLYESEIGRALFFACGLIMLHPQRSSDFSGQVRRLLGPARFDQLMLLLGYIRLAHFWTEIHPEIAIEPDLEQLLQRHGKVAALIRDQPAADAALRDRLQSEHADLVALRESRERFRALADGTEQIVWSADAAGMVTEDSPSWRSFTGQSVEQWLEDGWLNAVHPGDRQQTADRWKAAIEARGNYSMEYRLRHVSGAWKWTAARAYPLIDSNGTFRGMVGLNIDITPLKEAETAARESEERFRLLVEGTGDTAIYAMDAVGRIRSWNLGAQRITGYTAAEAIGQHFSMFFPTDLPEHQRPAALLEAARRSGEARDQSWRIRKDGSRFWADVTITANRDSTGELRGFSNIKRDLTESRSHLVALEEAEERARLLLTNAAQGILGVRVDGTIELVNATASRMFGYDADELTGQRIELLIPEPIRAAHVDHRAIFAAHPATRIMGVGRELSARRKDGEIFPVEVTLTYLTTSKGSLSVAFVTDITDRQRDRDELNRSLERFRLLSENVPELVWTCRPDGRCDYLNQRWADYTGIPTEDQLGNRWLNRLHPADREPTMAIWHRVVAAGDLLDTEFRIQHHDGQYRWFRARATALRERGEIVKWFGSNTDIHDLKLAMEKLQAANSDLASFAYIAAHDIQEPLRTVSSFTQLLERHLAGSLDERGRLLMNQVRSAAKRMSLMFTDLLAYTEAGSDIGTPEDVDLRASVAKALENLAVTIRENNAKIVVGDLPTVPGKSRHFVQTFQNLISNAIKYRDEQPPLIEINATAGEGHWTVRVSDNGIGIDPSHHKTIFGLFKRLHGVDQEGTGIGLAICERIISGYGGRIWVESRGFHQGSTFVLELPRP